ncbi:RibD family protein [Aidingimonas lacisalsi]|uniref:RibD family protein n=1 Tax=Aidingimonas lacisalsi TaxID=2604086 RepID=UPI00137580A1|nr:RibD family protein [Aidingimonas lacisalsi]
MALPPLDDRLAWACIRRIHDGDTVGAATLCRETTGHSLHIDTGDSVSGWHYAGRVDTSARQLLDCLLPLVVHRGDLAIAQLGQSLDGRIATVTGHSHYINGAAGRVHLHRLRALVDAVLVGAGTVVADDPRLTVRHVEGRHPTRVILDPNGRIPADRQVFQDGTAATLHLVGAWAPVDDSLGAHVTRVIIADTPGDISPVRLLSQLARHGYRRVLIEGGAATVSRFLDADVLDRLHLLVAPLLIGSGEPGIRLTSIDTLDLARRPVTRRFDCGDDTLFDVVMRDRFHG